MPRVKIGTRHQVTIPAETLKRLGLAAGEELEVIEHDKMLVLVPAKHIPTDQRWYYTEAWQRMMQEAFEDLNGEPLPVRLRVLRSSITDLRS